MSTPADDTPGFIERIAAFRDKFAYVLIAVGVLQVALAGYLGLQWNSTRDLPAGPKVEEVKPGETPTQSLTAPQTSGDYLSGAIWAGLCGIVLFAGAAWTLSRKPGEGDPVHETRVTLMLLGGILGLLTSLLGFVFAWRWQKSVLLWINQGETGEAKWVLAALSVFFAGLVLLFVSVQFGRPAERTSVVIRRLLHGTNATLSGLLLMLVLVIVNVVLFLKLPDSVVTTAAAFKGLSPQSREFLKTIQQPVTLYLVLPENFLDEEGYTGLYADCRSLLLSVEEQNPLVKVRFLSPSNDIDEIRRVQEKLDLPKDQRGGFGIMIGMGENEIPSAFISANELLTISEKRLVFQGEARLMTELNFLNSGARRPVIYFTQSNGEPSLTGPSEANPRSCAEIVRDLTERKFEVKPLFLDPGKRIDITDAALIVIAAPRVPFSPKQVEMLLQYMQPPEQLKAIPGRIIALLPATEGVDGKVAPTGLEPLCNGFGINVENRRIFTLPDQGVPAVAVLGTLDPSFDEKPMLFGNVRFVAPLQGLPPTLRSGAIMYTTPRIVVYQDALFASNPKDVERQLLKERAEASVKTEQEKMVTAAPVSFGLVAVELVKKGEQSEQRMRLAVIGSDSLIDDAILKQPSTQPERYKRVLARLIDRMRDRPDGFKIEPRALGTFSLPQETNDFGMIWLPLFLLLLTVSGLGFGVWYARRR